MKLLKKSVLPALFSVLLTSSINANEVGIQLHTMRNHMAEDLPKALENINKWGIEVVEGGGKLYGRSVNEFKALLDKYQLDMVSVDSSFEEIRDNPIAAVYKAQTYGAKFATVYWIPHEFDKPFTIEHAKEAVEVFNKAGVLLKQNGITLQYHPHGYEFQPYGDGYVLDYMLENTNHAKFQMDVYWIQQGGGDPLTYLKKYEGKFTSLHLKDRRKGSPNSTNGSADKDTNVTLGTGDIDIAGIMKEANRQGLRFSFIEDESTRVLDQVPASLEYLNSL